MSVSADPFVGSIRDEISALDVRLVATINQRIKKVVELHRVQRGERHRGHRPDAGGVARQLPAAGQQRARSPTKGSKS